LTPFDTRRDRVEVHRQGLRQRGDLTRPLFRLAILIRFAGPGGPSLVSYLAVAVSGTASWHTVIENFRYLMKQKWWIGAIEKKYVRSRSSDFIERTKRLELKLIHGLLGNFLIVDFENTHQNFFEAVVILVPGVQKTLAYRVDAGARLARISSS